MIKFENKVNGRFYYMRVENDLFGHLTLHIIRGGNHSVRTQLVGYNSAEQIDKEIARLSKRRTQRGYTLIS